MTRFLTPFAAAGAIAVLAGLPLCPVPVAAQAQTAARGKAGSPDGGGASASRAPKAPFIPPKTTWGDPNISGNLTNASEANTPFERSTEFAGKRLEDVTPDELDRVVKQRKQAAVEDAPFVFGSRPEGIAIGVPIHWLENLDAENSRPWFVIDPPDGKIPPLTEEAAARAPAAARPRAGRSVADSYTDRSLGDRCISRRGVPAQAMTPGLYGNSYQILQTRDWIAIRYEMDGVRMIPLQGRGASRPHVSGKVRSYFGDAIGRWEGNTLVVDTTNFLESVNYRGSRDGLHLIERFTRTAPRRIEWTVTVDDPRTWTRPWTFSIPLSEDDDQLIFEYGCHEGNYAMRNVLAGARKDQQKGIEPSNGPALPPGVDQP